MSLEAKIEDLEARLLEAFSSNDLPTLDALLHDDLLFNIPNGQTISKTMDLEAFRSGNVQIASAIASDQQIQIMGDVAIVAVTITIMGSYYGQPMDGRYRYLRVWKMFGEDWKVVGGSCIQATTIS
jgi:ketosteroid isomerase-like protein